MFILSSLNPISLPIGNRQLFELANQLVQEDRAETLLRVQKEGYTTIKLCKDHANQILHITIVNQCLSPNEAIDLSDELIALTQDDRYTGFEKVILNLRNVKAMNKRAFSGVIVLHNYLQQQGGRLQICDINDNIRETLSITRFDQFLNTSNNEEEAIKSLQG